MSEKKIKKKPVEIFPWIYDISPFIIEEHPSYHPLSTAYEDYWLGIEKLIVEGKWGLDSDGKNGGWRYMFGSQQFFINLGVVSGESDDSNTSKLIRPICRDIDWVIHYGYNIARGFSGHEWDEKQTCHRTIEAIERLGYKNISPQDKIFLEKHESVLKTPKGNWKKYVDPIDYLYNTKPENLGRALFYNEALNLIVMGPRGYGKSWIFANIFSYEFRVSGMRVYNDDYLYNLPPVELVVLSSIADKSNEFCNKFVEVEKHLRTLGEWKRNSTYFPGYFYLNTTGTLKSNNVDSPYTHKYTASKGKTWDKETGTGNKIFHLLATTQNPDIAVGKRPIVILHEEAALAANEDKISKANQNSLKKETFFGTEIPIATGGNFLKIGPMKKKFLDPIGNRCVPYPDIYRPGSNKKIGLMIPVTHVKLMFKNKNGNTDIHKAFEQEMYDRKLYENDQAALNTHKVYNCLDYDEMFGGTQDNIYPVHEIADTILNLELNIEKNNEEWFYGEFVQTGQAEYKFSLNKDFISKWMNDPLKDKDIKNDVGVLIFQRPVIHKEPKGYWFNPYKMVFDVIRDEVSGVSQNSFLVYKDHIPNVPIDEYTDNIVAAHIGRHENPDITYRIAINMADYYGCKILYENNIEDFFKFCRRIKRLDILQPTPWLAIDNAVQNPSKKRKYGVDMSVSLKPYAGRLALLKAKEKVNYEGETVMWIQRIKLLRLLYELALFTEIKNKDAYSSYLILVLWLDQEKDPKATERYEKEKEKKDSNLLESLKKENDYDEYQYGEY